MMDAETLFDWAADLVRLAQRWEAKVAVSHRRWAI